MYLIIEKRYRHWYLHLLVGLTNFMREILYNCWYECIFGCSKPRHHCMHVYIANYLHQVWNYLTLITKKWIKISTKVCTNIKMHFTNLLCFYICFDQICTNLTLNFAMGALGPWTTARKPKHPVVNLSPYCLAFGIFDWASGLLNFVLMNLLLPPSRFLSPVPKQFRVLFCVFWS